MSTGERLQSLIQEAEDQGLGVTPAAPSPVLDKPIEVEEYTPPVARDGDEPATEYGADLQRADAATPIERPNNRPEQLSNAPSFTESLGWSIDEMGVVGNLYRLAQQELDTEDPAAVQEIDNAFEELTYNVPEEYHEYIAGQPSLKAAERESERIRKITYRDKVRANEGLTQAATTGVLGFGLDPVNLVPGAAIVKGLGMTARIGMKYGVVGNMGLKTKMATWGAAGTVEEAVRLAPRLASDPTYTREEYIQDAAFGLAMGAGLPVLGVGLRAVQKKIPGAVKAVNDAAHRYGLDSAFRSTVNTAENVTKQFDDAQAKSFVQKSRDIDIGKAVREARERAKQDIDNKVRELNDVDVSPKVAAAVDAADNGGIIGASQELFDSIVTAVKKRTKKDVTETATAARESIGAAQRKQSLAEDVGDVVYDVKQAGKDAVQVAREAYDTTVKFVEDTDLPAEAKAQLKQKAAMARDSAIRKTEEVLRSKGIRPERVRLNNRDHAAAAKEAVENVRSASKRAFNEMDKRAADEGIELDGFSFGAYGNSIMKSALRRAGIVAKEGETLAQAVERSLAKITSGGMRSHVGRANQIHRLSVGVRRGFEGMHAKLDELDISPDEAYRLAEMLEDAREKIGQQIHLAEVIGRNPYEDAVVTKTQWAAIAEGWAKNTDTGAIHEQYVESTLQGAVSKQFGPLTHSMSARLLRSGSNLAGWFTTNVLEVPAGFGGSMTRNTKTASIVAEMLERKNAHGVYTAWSDMMKEHAKVNKWGRAKRFKNHMGNGNTHQDMKEISRQILLEVNARQHKFKGDSGAPAHIKKYVDTLTEQYGKLHDLQNGKVAGITDTNKIDNYIPQDWDNSRITLLLNTPNGRRSLEDLFQQGYIGAGFQPKLARKLAKDMVDGKVAASNRPKTGTRIGEEEPETLSAALREEMQAELGEDIPTYAKNRVKIDLSARATVDGEIVQLSDLLNQDVQASFTKYNKESTARVAISDATDGALNSDQAMNEFIEALALEAQSTGAVVNTADVETALRVMLGKRLPNALSSDARRVRDAVALARMGGLGESQLAEFGMAIAAGTSGLMGMAQKASASGGNLRQWAGMQITPEMMENKRYMQELQEVSSIFGDMYLIEPQNIHFDAMEQTYNGASKVVTGMTGGKYQALMRHLQGRITGYGAIRQMEEQIAMASAVQDILKHYDPNGKAFMSEDRLRDLGVPTDGGWLKAAMDEHIVRRQDGSVQSLNLEEWSDSDRLRLGVILNRYAGQQVQKSFVGETSPEMLNPWVAFLMQFKSYQLTAAEKQQGRALKFADKEAAYTVAINYASSAAARMLRYQSAAMAIPDEDKRQEYLNRRYDNLHFDTFSYMGVASMTPNIVSLFGGAANGQISMDSEVAVAGYVSDYATALGGPINDVGVDRDVRNAQVVTPLGTTAVGNTIFRIIQEMIETDAE